MNMDGGLCGFAGVAVGAEGGAKGAAEKHVEVGQDGGSHRGWRFRRWAGRFRVAGGGINCPFVVNMWHVSVVP